ncbi:endolytic transglycosylase MltG [Amycolatopsis sp. YIM 10]|uniref:endolytic transglycosylase MltG n=1 Tax=Amycolatopsis sp. YIM 10 TaxID=2653857 RepID=UPI001D155809|nr:endolytic transglycosylase MltG [Amycolatopsis sp. YIM 10]
MRSESPGVPEGGGRRRRREADVPPEPAQPRSAGRRRLREEDEPVRREGELRMPPPREGSGGRRRLRGEEPPSRPEPAPPRRRHRYVEADDDSLATPELGVPAPPEPQPPRRAPARPPVQPVRRPRAESPAPPPPARRRPTPPPAPPQPPPDDRPTEVIDAGQVARYGLEPDPEPVPEFDDRDRSRDRDDEYESFADDEFYDDYYDEDEYAEYDDEDRAAPERIGEEPPDEPRPRRKRSKRAFGWIAAVLVIVVVGGAAWFGAQELLGFGYDDFEGTGESDVLVEVADGDSTNAIATKMTQAGVVASQKAFTKAAEDENKVRSIQPGYYQMKTKMSGSSAVGKLVDPASRKGVLQIRGGTQLDDIVQPDGKTTDGVFALLSKSSCATVNGASTCVPVEELRKVSETADLATLGVPDWAVEGASKVEPKRRIEGLIQPGVYDVKPGWDATQLLTEVLKASTTRLQAAGLPKLADGTGKSPYELLVIASIVEREGVQQDFTKIARVIYNRLEDNMRLEMDSTINYVLDRPIVTTTPEDREKAGAYNTYQNKGLTPGPISSPSKEAIDAAAKPAEGAILFFVKCEKNGLSCFAETLDEHNQNKNLARERGAY